MIGVTRILHKTVLSRVTQYAAANEEAFIRNNNSNDTPEDGLLRKKYKQL